MTSGRANLPAVHTAGGSALAQGVARSPTRGGGFTSDDGKAVRVERVVVPSTIAMLQPPDAPDVAIFPLAGISPKATPAMQNDGPDASGAAMTVPAGCGGRQDEAAPVGAAATGAPPRPKSCAVDRVVEVFVEQPDWSGGWQASYIVRHGMAVPKCSMKTCGLHWSIKSRPALPISSARRAESPRRELAERAWEVPERRREQGILRLWCFGHRCATPAATGNRVNGHRRHQGARSWRGTSCFASPGAYPIVFDAPAGAPGAPSWPRQVGSAPDPAQPLPHPRSPETLENPRRSGAMSGPPRRRGSLDAAEGPVGRPQPAVGVFGGGVPAVLPPAAASAPEQALPPLPPAAALSALIDAYFAGADPSYPLLHLGAWRRNPPPPLLLSAVGLVALRLPEAAEIPGVDAATRDVVEIGLFARSRAELQAALASTPPGDPKRVLRLLQALCLLMYWCESRAMEKTDRELQGAAWNVVRRSYLGDGPLSAFLGPWDGVLLAALDVPTMEHARTVQLVPQQVAVLRDAVVSRLELDCALWFLLAHACAYRSVRREVHDPLPADILSGLVLHLLAQPSHPQWKATFADPFDPRFWDHPCLRISPLVAWADMPHGSPERAASLALYKEGRIRTRSATPLATFWLRLQADELLAGLRRAGLTPADLGRSQFAVDDGSPHSSGSSENLHPPVDTAADLLALRDKVELAISDLHAQLPPDIQDAWERADLPAVIRAIVPIFGTRESAVTGVYCGIKLQTIRLEIRSPIGLLLLAPDPSFPDAAGPAPNDLDLPDPSTRWGRGLPPLLPDLLLSARLLSQLASLHPPTRIPTRRFLPPLLAISLLLASLFRRLRTLAAAGDPLPPGAWDAATHHLGLCLSALHGLVEKAPEHAVGVYGAVKAAVETGAVPRGGEAPVLAGEGLVQVLGAR